MTTREHLQKTFSWNGPAAGKKEVFTRMCFQKLFMGSIGRNAIIETLLKTSKIFEILQSTENCPKIDRKMNRKSTVNRPDFNNLNVFNLVR